MKHIDISFLKSENTKNDYLNQTVTVCGWVRTSRDSKNMAFMEINDGTTFKHLQIVIDKSQGVENAEAMHLGTSVKV
ncbi:MAG: asparagine--tRNA ligase, partial [Oscillospiraceae bacterium]|nr:asparagine--tRNA ligase [Oscillospiraceae bacterium]